jgi:hypothetical protein
MMRRIAVVGDKLETGGQILPYGGPVFTVGDAGHQVALIGGTAWCETCNSTGVIVKAGGPRRIEFVGETAADRDVVLCQCPTHPPIVAVLAGDSWCDDMVETSGTVAPQTARDSGPAAKAVGTTVPIAADQYDERFVLRDTDGHALTHAAYAVQRKNGIFEYGETDANGHTHLLSSAARPEDTDIYVKQ